MSTSSSAHVHAPGAGLAAGSLLFIAVASAEAASFVGMQTGPNEWTYTLTYDPGDNYAVCPAPDNVASITLSGLAPVASATSPTSTDFPYPDASFINLQWVPAVLRQGTTVTWTHLGPGTGNWPIPKHVFGFKVITETQVPNGTVSVASDGFSIDVSVSSPCPVEPSDDRDFTGTTNGPMGAPECSDALDNDGDDDADYPADSGCDSPADVSENSLELVCDDGIDNDGDDDADFPNDPGCDSPSDESERSPGLVCDDGFDNDSDEYADFRGDPGCDSAIDESERSEALVCDDGLDNDDDGLADFPTDPGCTDPAANSELGTCQDGIDNDGDGFTDYPADLDCSSLTGALEAPDADSDGVADTAENCVTVPNPSQLDSNYDGYGDACDADYDDDGVVSNSDFVRLRRAFGATLGSPNYDPALDVDGDGAIGIPEFALLRSSLGSSPGPSGLPCATAGGCYCQFHSCGF